MLCYGEKAYWYAWSSLAKIAGTFESTSPMHRSLGDWVREETGGNVFGELTNGLEA